MTAPSTPPSDTPEPALLLAALRALNVTIAYEPLPGIATATWHAPTRTLILDSNATKAERDAVMMNLWMIAHGVPGNGWAKPRRRHLHLVP